MNSLKSDCKIDIPLEDVQNTDPNTLHVTLTCAVKEPLSVSPFNGSLRILGHLTDEKKRYLTQLLQEIFTHSNGNGSGNGRNGDLG